MLSQPTQSRGFSQDENDEKSIEIFSPWGELR